MSQRCGGSWRRQAEATWIKTNIAVGGSGGAAGRGSDVTVTNDNNASITILIENHEASGIIAQSIAGGGGIVKVLSTDAQDDAGGGSVAQAPGSIRASVLNLSESAAQNPLPRRGNRAVRIFCDARASSLGAHWNAPFELTGIARVTDVAEHVPCRYRLAPCTSAAFCCVFCNPCG